MVSLRSIVDCRFISLRAMDMYISFSCRSLRSLSSAVKLKDCTSLAISRVLSSESELPPIESALGVVS